MGSVIGTITGFISDFFGNILSLCYEFTNNYGLALILFTFFTKLILFPIEIKQQKSRIKMSRFNAKQSELRKKYAQDKTKLNQELLKLQEREGNPMLGGCLSPILVVAFVWIIYALVRAPLTSCIHISPDKISKAAEILGINKNDVEIHILQNLGDLQSTLVNVFSAEEMASISALSNNFNFCGLSLIPALSDAMWLVPPLVITSFASALIMQIFTNKDQANMPGCSKYLMPCVAVIFPFLFMWSIPAAVGFYWVIGNVALCIQSCIINIFFNQNLLIAKNQAARIALREMQESAIN